MSRRYPGDSKKIDGKGKVMVTRILLGVLIGGAIGAVLGYFGKCSSGRCPLTANPYRGAIYGAVVGALLTPVFWPKSQEKPRSSNIDHVNSESDFNARALKEKSGSSDVVHINSESDFRAKVLDVSGICLVDLFSNNCPPCRVLAPVISSLADRYAGSVTVCKVDVDRIPAIAQRYRVMAIPTVLIINNGKEVKRLVGLKTGAEYIAILDKLVENSRSISG